MERFAVRGQLAIGDELIRGVVIVAGSFIEAVEIGGGDRALPERVIEAEIVAPGLIDLQVNGGFGVEVGDDPEALRTLAKRLPETGVTSFLPTVITSPAAAYPAAIAAFEHVRGMAGADAVGLHLEGPFLSVAKKGAHVQEWIEAADPQLIELFAASEAVRLVTLAPETPGAIERIRNLAEAGKVVSLGHTAATFAELSAGIDAGASMVTHLYNAMSGLGHREPGAAGAALTDARVIAGLIVDGEHVAAPAVQIAVRMKGAQGIALVSDMMSAAGMPPGTYLLNGQSVTSDGRTVRLEDGTLAGSLLTMDAAVRNVVAMTGCSVASAIRMATETPARAIGLADRGRLAAGLRADLCLFDAGLQVTGTIIGGQVRIG